ncbi:TIGR02300 family protein [Acuticoccus sp. MNP-M23]|uniref:TIGR02300 family protein n=1 Tax=Acuticoccus sp. MNP-M23 TaxID=3072793 RepID=UPI0028160598|nr:TIGR02300 family protein [Acuticoccus sp. MNP-M23]WMS43738.1 TIGR02300 family protein [Acuticoccus sp. MNP-M23]
MARAELGTKRLCPNCGAKYYDLNRDPVVCPQCNAAFATGIVGKARPETAKAVADEDEDDDEDEGVELVSLDEAETSSDDDDDEIESDDVVVADDDDVVVIDDDDEDGVSEVVVGDDDEDDT